MIPSGIINLNKPSGITSRQAVDIVKRLARPAKVGHAGTLDPLADGVLVICLGEATRLIEYVQRMPKQYRGTFLLGRSSPTEDIEGEVVELPDARAPTLAEIHAAAGRFIGRIEQRPPAFSALKLNGRRAYDLARRGEQVALAPRAIYIHRLDVVEYDYPKIVLEIECGGGTYIRSLGRDLAAALGTAAVMSALTRTAVGAFHLEQSVAPDVIINGDWSQWIEPPLRAVASLPRVVLSDEQLVRTRNGMPIELKHPLNRCMSSDKTPNSIKQGTNAIAECVEEIAALDAAGRLAAILVPLGDGRVRPRRNFIKD